MKFSQRPHREHTQAFMSHMCISRWLGSGRRSRGTVTIYFTPSRPLQRVNL